MKKPLAKRTAKSQCFQLNTNESWDTVQAQILIKISAALSPPVLDFSAYDLMFHIPRVVTKPGMPLMTDTDYNLLIERAQNAKAKDPMVNVSVVEKAASEDKENEEVEKEKPKKKVCHLPTSQPRDKWFLGPKRPRYAPWQR